MAIREEHGVEKTWGPLHGFYFAAYAAPAGDGERYCSYAKVCWLEPASYWEAECAFKLFGGEHHASAQAALEWVAREAVREVAGLPARARTLAEQRRLHDVPVPRLFASALFRHRLA